MPSPHDVSHDAYTNMAAEMAARYAQARPAGEPIEVPVEPITVRSAAPADPHETTMQPAERHEEPSDRQYSRIERIAPVTQLVNTIACFGAIALPGIVFVSLPENQILSKFVASIPVIAAVAILVMAMRRLQRVNNEVILINHLCILLAIATSVNIATTWIAWSAFRR